jgi:glyoxylase-like metal-dependent hydrolase (beta-lactamase superfamily II)
VNTHWHLDHVGGNPALRAAFPDLTVYASDAIDAALSGFLARSREQLEQMLAREPAAPQREAMQAEIARIDAGAVLRPDVGVDAAGERVLAGRRVQVGFESDSVTAGDVWLFDPATRVLIAGDLVTLPAPVLDTACPSRWRTALARLEAEPFETLVPGHTAPLSRAQFALYRRAFDRLLACGASDLAAANCVERCRADAGPLLSGHPPELTRNLVDYYVSQRLRGAGATRDCPAPAALKARS